MIGFGYILYHRTQNTMQQILLQASNAVIILLSKRQLWILMVSKKTNGGY